MADPPTIVFAGGGTGGHIFPNMAILDRLREKHVPVKPHFLVSTRPLDRQILHKHKLEFTEVPAKPFGWQPRKLIAFMQAFKRSRELVGYELERLDAAAVVATGGFVSGPAVAAAADRDLPVALVNLDAIPGKANRQMASKATAVFSVYSTQMLKRAQTIGLPLRRSAIANLPKAKARYQLGLRPDLDTILVTAGSQGASTINEMMMELTTRTEARKALSQWQVLHLSGVDDQQDVTEAYRRAGIRARVEAFLTGMGLAWAAATVAVSRAGAGSVAEAWANAVPTIFFPYPYHKDAHQRYNAEPLVNAGAALMLKDEIDPVENANQVTGPLTSLMRNDVQRALMTSALRETRPPDGAETLADWLMVTLGLRGKPDAAA